ncbi:hypothetical protein VNO77_05307 [Canavalia gladiata]|uniref:non-specific serine/threonine protein kinase n=1 Tax=Canavalia gladiata TaxID=3824 RepID=A0AAN9N054_CANGL
MAMQAFGILLAVLYSVSRFVSSDVNFVRYGFLQAGLNLDGASYVRPNGILTLTNDSSKILGHAFYPSPLPFKSSKNKSIVATFSTTFVFSIVPKYPDLGGHGFAFVLISTNEPKGCLVNQYLGLPNEKSNQDFSTRFLAVEFDGVQNLELEDIDDNHVGIDISSLISNISKSAAYYLPRNGQDHSKNISISLKCGKPIQAWVDYNEEETLMNVTISPFGMPKPYFPLISFPIDLSLVFNDYMYAGFSASNGLLIAEHNVHGWSFKIGEAAQELDKSAVPLIGSSRSSKVVHKKDFAVGITLASATLFILIIIGALHVLRRLRNEEETLEVWELEYGARKFKYSELHSATGRFGERNLIGYGGFGKVYKGLIPSKGLEVAVKRVAPNSGQDLQPKLGDFGLARTYEHGINPQTTHVVGTLGYMAPELTKTGKATTSTDVYGYGILILEVVCGRRPIEPQKNPEELVLVDWVRELYHQRKISMAIDPSLDVYDKDEAQLVLSLG